MRTLLADSDKKFLYVLLLAAILVFSPLKAIIIPGVVLLIALSLPLYISIVSRAVLGFALYFSLNTISGGIAHILDIALPVEALLLLQLGFVIVLRITLPKQKDIKTYGHSILPSIAGLALLSVIFIFLTLPILRAEGYEVYRKVTYGGDNTSHIELIKAVVDRGRYFYEKPVYTGYVITENLAGYPQGLHYNAYVFIESIKPLVDVSSSHRRFLSFYYMYTVGIYLTLAALYLVTIMSVARPRNVNSIIIGISSVGILFTGIFFSLFALGFQTQIASLALLLGMLVFLHTSSESTEAVTAKAYFILALVMLAGISFTWLFLLPVSSLIILLYWLDRFGLKTLVKYKANALFILICAILLMTTFIQPAVQLLHQTTKTSGVNEIGFTVIPSTLIVVALAVLSLGFIPVVFKRTKSLWMFALGSASFFSLYVYIYQWSHVGEARYYFHKSLFTLLILSSIILVLAAGEFINYISEIEHRQRATILSSILVVGVLVATYNLSNKNDYYQKQAGGGFSSELAVTIGGLIESNNDNGKKIIAVGSCNRAHDYTASRLAATLTGDHDILRQGLISGLLAPDKTTLIKSIKKYQHIRSPELIIISTDYGLQKQLEAVLDDGYGKETFVDLDFGHAPKVPEACPHLVK